MAQVARYAWDVVARTLPDRMLAYLSGEELIAPCFHLVIDGEAPQHVRQIYQCLDLQAFRKDLDRLLQHRVPVSLQDLEDHITTGRKLPQRSAFISFDDGMREMHEIVAPLCWAKGIPVTFFLTTGFLDNRALFFRHKASILLDELELREETDRILLTIEMQRQLGARGIRVENLPMFLRGVRYREAHYLDICARVMDLDFEHYLRNRKPYLTEEQVESLLRKGFSVGGHSVDHPLFSDLDLGEQIHQTRECMRYLRERFSIGFKAFAFPFVSNGVPMEFYDMVFGEQTVDMAFCIGDTPPTRHERIIERFGVEDKENQSLTLAWREHASRRVKQYVSRSVRKLRMAGA